MSRPLQGPRVYIRKNLVAENVQGPCAYIRKNLVVENVHVYISMILVRSFQSLTFKLSGGKCKRVNKHDFSAIVPVIDVQT